MNLILHLGIEKTGSSSIQNFLFENKKALENSGYGYIHTTGRVDHREIAVAFMRTSRSDSYTRTHNIEGEEVRSLFSERVKLQLTNEVNSLRRRGIQTCVISSEHLSSRLKDLEEISGLGSFLLNLFNNVFVVAYVRDQRKKVTSQYSTRIKSGGTLKFRDTFQRYLRNSNDFYDRKFSVWESIFGEAALRLQVFDRKSFVRGDLIQDFLSLSRIQIDHNNLIIPTSNANTALNRNACEILRRINIFLPKDKLVSQRIRESLVKKLNQLPGGSLSLTHEQSEIIEEKFLESNNEFRRKYFPNKKSLFE